MKSRVTFPEQFVALALTVLGSTGAAAGKSDGSVVYDIVDLGTLGGPTSGATGINDRGQVVGSSTLPGGATTHAFLYFEGRMTDLGTLAGGSSQARAVNDSGDVTGSSDGTAFVYHNGAMQDLGTLGGIASDGYAINSARWVVGSSYTTFLPPPPAQDKHAVVFCLGETIDLGAILEGRSIAFGINDANQVVGVYTTPLGNVSHAFLYDGRVIELARGTAYAINRKGQVTGYSDSTGTVFLYDGVTHDLGALEGSYFTSPSSINDAAKIVGTALFVIDSFTSYERAFLYDGSRFVDLNNLIPAGSRWLLYEATGINNSGQIVGRGNHGGRDRAFLLTPRRDSRE